MGSWRAAWRAGQSPKRMPTVVETPKRLTKRQEELLREFAEGTADQDEVAEAAHLADRAAELVAAGEFGGQRGAGHVEAGDRGRLG